MTITSLRNNLVKNKGKWTDLVLGGIFFNYFGKTHLSKLFQVHYSNELQITEFMIGITWESKDIFIKLFVESFKLSSGLIKH